MRKEDGAGRVRVDESGGKYVQEEEESEEERRREEGRLNGNM